jgi:predicted helicase
LQFEVGEIERAIYAKVVQKCGNRSHWEEWANDIAKIARTHIIASPAFWKTQPTAKDCEAFNSILRRIA